MRAFALAFTACWTGSVPEPSPAPPRAVKPANAEIRGISRCGALGPRTLILKVPGHDDTGFTIEILYRATDRVPRVVIEDDHAVFSPCRLHGCSVANVLLDELEIGKRAAGRYRIKANAGYAYIGDFEAAWVGTPWAIECPPDEV